VKKGEHQHFLKTRRERYNLRIEESALPDIITEEMLRDEHVRKQIRIEQARCRRRRSAKTP